MTFAPDGQHTLATGNFDGTVFPWDVTDPSRPTRIGNQLTGHTDGVFSVAFAPDGYTLAASTNGAMFQWASPASPPCETPLTSVHVRSPLAD